MECQVSQTVQELYREAQAELEAANVPANVIAAEFSSFKSQSSSLHRRRANKLPSVPTNFEQLDITGQFALTTGGQPFLRNDNKSGNSRIILLICDQTLKILGAAISWFINGTFPSGYLQACCKIWIETAL